MHAAETDTLLIVVVLLVVRLMLEGVWLWLCRHHVEAVTLDACWAIA